MSITIINKTICCICEKVIEQGEVYRGFPPFISNVKDPLYFFNDASFHIECIKSHPSGNRAIKFADDFIINTSPTNRRCIVDNKRIENIEDYIFMGLLTSNDNEELFEFNFTTLNKKNLNKWTHRKRFIEVAIKFELDGKWGDFTSFKYLENLIKVISFNI